MIKPKNISIIVTTYNWKEALEIVLINLCQQSVLPNEIVIADDGSKEDTKQLIEALKTKLSVPIKHVWQADDGFQLSKIRNKAIVACECEYIIQIDGDCVPHQHFVKDHLEMAEVGTYVCGSRAYCTQNFSEKWMTTKQFNPFTFIPIKGSFLNILRNSYLRRKLVDFRVTVKGSNMAFWKKDLVTVNGYDEDYKGWGFEDNDLVARLQNAGIKQKTLKMGGIQYHLYHKESERPSEKEYQRRMAKIKFIEDNRITRAQNGLDKYIINAKISL